MRYYPLFLDLTSQRVVVIGGGRVAERKVRLLLACHADLVLISPTLTQKLRSWSRSKHFLWRRRRYRRGDLRGVLLAIAASDQAAVNSRVADEAKQKGVVVNIVDDPARSSAIAPSWFRRGELVVAFSTGGKSPALAQQLRKELSRELGRDYAAYITLLARIRRQVMQRVSDPTKRRHILHRVVKADLLPLIRRADRSALNRRVKQLTGGLVRI